MTEKELDISEVKFEIGKFAVDFLQHYLRFMGNKETVEDVARDALFEEICRLRDQLRTLPYHKNCEFFRRYPGVKLLASREEQDFLEELERRQNHVQVQMQKDC